MKLVTPRGLGISIKEKKNSIINDQYQSQAQQQLIYTPTKTITNTERTPVKRSSNSLNRGLFRFSQSPSLKQQQLESYPRTQPKNAFNKKCFKKGREIKTIKKLQQYYDTNIPSKSPYKFKQSQSVNNSALFNHSYSNILNKKTRADRIPSNLFAMESSVKQHSVRHDGQSRSSSASKLIKSKIIKYEM